MDTATHFRLQSRPRRIARVSLTPLIDVVFILLVFFMLASSFADWRAIRMTTAERSGARAAASMVGALMLDLAPGGVVSRIGGPPLDVDGIARVIGSEPDMRVVIRPLPGVRVAETVRLVDLVTQAGASSVDLMAVRETRP